MLDLNASTLDGPEGPVLSVRWTYATDGIAPDRIRTIADRFTAALTELVRRHEEPGFAGHSPGDFPVALDQHEITELEAAIPALDGVLPLTPLQHGLAFHALTVEPGADPYVVQLELEISGPLDPVRLRAAAGAVVDRHANLRAGFRRLTTGRLVQYTAADAGPEWTEHDLRAGRDAPATEALSALVTADRVRPFAPDRPPLLRFTLIRTADDRWRLLFTSHHLLLDGWSAPLLLTDLFDAYAGRPRSAAAPSPTTRAGSPTATARPPKPPGAPPSTGSPNPRSPPPPTPLPPPWSPRRRPPSSTPPSPPPSRTVPAPPEPP
ncbi:Condensation domain-containing protein [Streptomyces sp. Cmuel-A718b]|nr:Condensation domain-containing protein [Streptomyces sp. Cmuel-A718b]